MYRRAGSGRQRAITTEENENLTENLICLQEDYPGKPNVTKGGWKKYRYKPYFRKTNDKEKRIKAVQMFEGNHD